MTDSTPGPWIWRATFNAGYTGYPGYTLFQSGSPVILTGRTKRSIANRSLIAVAPDMLEALKQISKTDCGSDHAGIARAAIAKAEGGSIS